MTLKDTKDKIPSPLPKTLNLDDVVDPNYPSLKFPTDELTDHFYDTGLYKIEWEKAKRAKVNHPFMGKMSFPENEDRPSRTIMATRAGSTRESLVYKSDYNRIGDGEYRMPTIREAATLMGFPYVFNFTGTESTKWKQIGNAVCPHMSFALAKELRNRLTSDAIDHDKIDFKTLIKNNRSENLKKYKFNNLNSGKEKAFDKTPKRSTTSKFRRHILKGGNMTVSLLNYSPIDTSIIPGEEWFMYVFLGSGSKFQSIEIKRNAHKEFEDYILKEKPIHKKFVQEAKKTCLNIPSKSVLHDLYVENNRKSEFLDVETFFEQAETLLETHSCEDIVSQPVFKAKENIPVSQILSMYLINLYFSNIK